MTLLTYAVAYEDQPDGREEPVSHQWATRRQVPSHLYRSRNLPAATFSWLAGVCLALELPRYFFAQEGQFDGMIWYLPYAPEVLFLAV